MDILRNLPYLILVIIGAVVLIGGIGYFSILQSINGHSSTNHSTTNHWESGRWFLLGLAVLVLVAFIVLLLVTLFSF